MGSSQRAIDDTYALPKRADLYPTILTPGAPECLRRPWRLTDTGAPPHSAGRSRRSHSPKTSNSKNKNWLPRLSKEKWLRALAILKIAAYTRSAQNLAHPRETISATSRHARRTLAGTGLGRWRRRLAHQCPALKPTPPLVIPAPVVPPAPTQASGPYNQGLDFAADIRLVPPPRRRNAGVPFAALVRCPWTAAHDGARVAHGLNGRQAAWILPNS
jgi:hypothetical protein